MTAILHLTVMYRGAFETVTRAINADSLCEACAVAAGEGLGILRRMNPAMVPGAHTAERYATVPDQYSCMIEAHAGGSIFACASKYDARDLAVPGPVPSRGSDALARLRDQANRGPAPREIDAVFGPQRRRFDDWTPEERNAYYDHNGELSDISAPLLADREDSDPEPVSLAWSAEDILAREG